MNLKLKIAEYGEFEDKFRANFFSELLPEEKLEFGDILKNLSMNAIEKAETLREWGRDRLSLAAFENFEEYLNVFLERDRKFQEKLKKLSPEAKEAYDKIQEIRKEKQIVMSRLSEKAKKELSALFKNECSVHHRTNLSRIQWDPVGVKKNEENERETDFGCYGYEIGSNLAPNYAPLTKSYGRDPPSTTPFSVPKIRSPMNPYPLQQPNHLSSTGGKLFQLLLQRVQYLKPLLNN
uniref:Uncharacterized protein n=1 Tax=Panagrolaimus sp. JU765 TaxID=591449 RepID=A0AC34RB70_9BILA